MRPTTGTNPGNPMRCNVLRFTGIARRIALVYVLKWLPSRVKTWVVGRGYSGWR